MFVPDNWCLFCSKLVTLDDWENIDFKRKERRKARQERLAKEKEEALEHAAALEEERSKNVPYLPRSIHQLSPGHLVKVLTGAGAAVLFGVVR